ncbi:MAG: tetratricopeptide repeat protein [Bacteroidetes bacterium]|nr:tetratricopeptide repeat protein [Bacteroidota bacterium]
MRLIILLCTALFILSVGWHCRSEHEVQQVFRNLDPEVDYVGMETCRSCHENIHETFIHTGMGQSFDRASKQKSAARFGDHALVYDEARDFYYYPFFKDTSFFVLEFRLDGQDTIYKRLEEIDYIIGSGHHTNSHLIDQNGYFYQAPITYYTQEERWDLAPGFDGGGNLRFSRYLTSECITCHNHLPQAVEGSLNKYHEMPTGIECERCHGPGELHVREKLAGEIIDTSKFADYSIVNPKRLPRDLQMDLCQRCHLQGLAVLEPGKDFYDFRPGMALSEVMNVYLPRYTDSHERFIMASQADRLRLSECYENSDLTCITCHNPHQSVREVDQTADFNKACQSCHGGEAQTFCSRDHAAKAEEETTADNCVHCHMPPSSSIDIPHVNITDHYISRENIRGKHIKTESEGEARFLGLKILTKENATDLDMARAYLDMYEKFVANDMMLDSARYYLDRIKGQAEALEVNVQYLYLRKDLGAITKLTLPETITSPWTAYRIGEAFFQTGDGQQAANWFAKAVEGQPLNLEFLEKLGIAQAISGQPDKAEENFRKVLSENSKRPIAHCNLGYLLALEGNFETAAYHYDKALDLDPDYEQALINKSAMLYQQQEIEGALRLLDRVLKINPDNEQARMIKSQLSK